jgi:hypothetical protein
MGKQSARASEPFSVKAVCAEDIQKNGQLRKLLHKSDKLARIDEHEFDKLCAKSLTIEHC